MQGKRLSIAQGQVVIDNKIEGGGHPPSDFKEFDPLTLHGQQLYTSLRDAFTYKGENYFKGLSCKCCVGEEQFRWQLDLAGGDSANLTWSNLLINGNYRIFLEEGLPLFSEYKNIYIVCNKEAYIEGLPFINTLRGAFDVGPNAMIDNRRTIKEIRDKVIKENIKGALFVLAASSLSNLIAHDLHNWTGNVNTIIDVGSALNHHMRMPINRSYLEGHWLGHEGKDNKKTCIW